MLDKFGFLRYNEGVAGFPAHLSCFASVHPAGKFPPPGSCDPGSTTAGSYPAFF